MTDTLLEILGIVFLTAWLVTGMLAASSWLIDPRNTSGEPLWADVANGAIGFFAGFPLLVYLFWGMSLDEIRKGWRWRRIRWRKRP